MMKAVSYLRLSQKSDTSIQSQREDTEQYCRDNNLELVKIFNDGQNSSGFNDDRPEYVAMKKMLKQGGIDAVVIRDRTRLGRDFDERMRFILDLRELDVELHTWTDGKLDLEDPYSVAVEGIHSASDDKKKREEIRKALHELEKRRERDCYQGRPPFGLVFGPDNCYLVRGEGFDRALKVIGMRDGGATLEEIRGEVGLSSVSVVHRVLKRRDLYLSIADEGEVEEVLA